VPHSNINSSVTINLHRPRSKRAALYLLNRGLLAYILSYSQIKLRQQITSQRTPTSGITIIMELYVMLPRKKI